MPRIRIVSTFVVSFCLWTGCASAPVDRGAQNATETLAHGAPVRIISWSDFHSSIYETPTKDGAALGGLPVFMAAVEHIRGDGLSLLVDGGDMFQGAMPFNEAKGMGMMPSMPSKKLILMPSCAKSLPMSEAISGRLLYFNW